MVFSERHFFLQKADRNLYCVEYLPSEEKRSDVFVILCKPIWGERIRTHMVFANLARFLAQNGYCVITCDYYGDGNSGGESHELNFPVMVDSLELIHDYIRENIQLTKSALIGLRLGANAAMGVEPRLRGVKKMLLFDPFERPIDYFAAALRANLANQMTVHKKILKTRDELIQDLKEDIFVNIDGFVIGRSFWTSFEIVSPFSVVSNFDDAVVVYSMTPPGRKPKPLDYTWLTGNYVNTEVKNMEQEFIWNGWKKHVPKPMAFMDEILSQINSIN